MAPYAGAPVSQVFRERWMTPSQIGAIAPVGMVEIRRGRLVRSMHPFPGLGNPTFGEYPGALAHGYWYPDWSPSSDWETLDAVQNIRLEQSFDTNGIQSATIKMDNRVLVEQTGVAGALYHVIESGYYSPLRGYVGPNRPDPGVAKSPFFQKLPNAQIRVRQGFGVDTLVTTFLGLIDDVDTESVPDQITLTCRDMGCILTDERFFGWAKEKLITPPVTFAPRHIAESKHLVNGSARASSEQDGHSADAAMVQDDPGGWRSKIVGSADQTQWIEFHVPEGKYSELYLNTSQEGMEIFLGVKPQPRDDGSPSTFDNRSMKNDLDIHGFWKHGADNTVPGDTNGGWHYFRRATSQSGAHFVGFGGTFLVGDNTIFRLGFRNLGAVAGGFQARVGFVAAEQREFKKNAISGQYIIIDDVSDIVKICLRWAGFKTWEIESAGVNLQEVYIADMSKSFMDVINEIKDMTGWTFFMGEPRDDNDDQDLGYPIFRNNRLFEDSTGRTEFIDDKLLLTDAKVKLSNQEDHCIVRCRGVTKKTGVTLGGDSLKRVMFAYIPAWAGEQAAKQAGILKPITHTDEKFTTVDDCEFGCYLIALQIALAKYTAIIDIPCNPGIGLDTLQAVIDRVQGLNSRLYVSNRTQEMQFGDSGFWTMELGGSLADTPDAVSVIGDYRAAIKRLDRKARNPYLRKRHGKALAYGYEEGG